MHAASVGNCILLHLCVLVMLARVGEAVSASAVTEPAAAPCRFLPSLQACNKQAGGMRKLYALAEQVPRFSRGVRRFGFFVFFNSFWPPAQLIFGALL